MATPSLTLTQAREQLQNWLTALEHCSTGSTYSIDGKTLTRQDVPTIRAEIQRWHGTIAALEQVQAGTVRPMGSTAEFNSPGSGSGGLIGQSHWTAS